MHSFGEGARLAVTCGLELHTRWAAFWRACQPWAWIYIGLSVLDLLIYPAGNPSRLMSLFWALLYLGLNLLMSWNWQNQLAGLGRLVGWDQGWSGQQFRVYIVTQMALIMGMPFAVVFVVGLPVLLVMYGIAGDTPVTIATMIGACTLALVLLFVRLSVLPAVLLTRISPPVVVAWQTSGKAQSYVFGAIGLFLLCSLLTFVLLAKLTEILLAANVSGASLIMLPLVLSAGFFCMGWYILLVQRLYTQLSSL